ncbi:MAG TPA: PilZ domain-containing protein [Polyangiaceae bacterium]
MPPPISSVHAQRRDPGAPRREASDRVVLRSGDKEVVGWTLNVSRGGARLVVEDTLEVGQHWELWVNDAPAGRPARVVWLRDEPGGQIVGIQYLDCEGTIPPFEHPNLDV